MRDGLVDKGAYSDNVERVGAEQSAVESAPGSRSRFSLCLRCRSWHLALTIFEGLAGSISKNQRSDLAAYGCARARNARVDSGRLLVVVRDHDVAVKVAFVLC